MALSKESAQISWVINNPGLDSFLFKSVAKLADYQKRTCEECGKLFATMKNRNKHAAKFHGRIPENVPNENFFNDDNNDQNLTNDENDLEPNLENRHAQTPLDEVRKKMNELNEQSNEENPPIDTDQNKRKRCSTNKIGRMRDLDASSDSNWILDSGRQKDDSTIVADGLKIRLRKIATRSSRQITLPLNKDRICPVCDKLFVTNKNRDKHMANFHKQNREKDSNESISTGEGDQNRDLISDNQRSEASMVVVQGAMNEKKNEADSMIDVVQNQQQQHSSESILSSDFGLDSDSDLVSAPVRQSNNFGVAANGAKISSAMIASQKFRKATVPMPVLLDMDIKIEPDVNIVSEFQM